jgi:hypothetical protein
MPKYTKETGSVTINLTAEVWRFLNEVHEETGINKSTQVENIIRDEVRDTESILSHCEEELDRLATQKLEEAERLFKIRDNTRLQRNKLAPFKPSLEELLDQKAEAKKTGIFRSIKPKPKMVRALSNTLAFTQDSVDGLRPQDKDVWFHDTQTSGLSIRSKKSGMTYYTRAKNETISKYTLRVKIADTKYMSLDKAKEVHAKNLKQILRDGINPNQDTLKVQHQGRHKNVATAFKEKEAVKTNVSEETKEGSTTDWKLYSGIRYNSGLGLQILGSLLNQNPDMKSSCLSKYMNGSYRIRGERLLDMFETDDMSIFEISRKELITDGRGQHGSRYMSLQNTVLQVCKAIYHHGSANDRLMVFGK